MTGSIRALLALACASMLAVGIAACGGDDGAADSGGGGGGADTVQVAMISSGSHTDSSFVESWWQGSQDAQQELGDAAEISWTDGLNSLDALDRAAGAALTEGNDYLFISTSEAPQLVDKYAQRFPDQWICDIETPRESYPDNVCTMYPRYQEGAFLAGALAGLVTETDKVGAVSAFDIPIQNLQVEAFLLGARYTNPDVSLARSYTESFIDAGAGRAAAQAQYAAGNDVLLSALDEGTRGMYVAADANDGLVITQYTDQYEAAPNVVLTSVLYRQAEISERMITTAVEGELEAKSYDFGLAEIGAGELAPFRGTPGERVTEQIANRIDEIQAAIEDGSLQLPDIATLSERGSAERVDPASLEG